MTISRLLPLASALLIAGAAHAFTHTVTATEDTYVEHDNSGPYGSAADLIVKNRGSNDTTRKVLIRFAAGRTNLNPLEAALSLDVSALSGGTSATFTVFGINTPAVTSADCDAGFSESTVRYKDLSYLDNSGNGVDDGSSCVFGGTPLGAFTIHSSDVGHTVSFSSGALIDYIHENAPFFGDLVFVITRSETSKDLWTAFASKENASLSGPRLSWTATDELGFSSTGGGAPSPDIGTPQHFTGALALPLANGLSITLPDADVDVSYAGGVLQSITGTVGAPALPQTGIFQYLDFSAPSLQVGYGAPSDFPADLADLGLPVDSNRKYFYLLAESGLSVTLGDAISLQSPSAGGQTALLIDQTTGTVIGYSNQIPFGDLPIEDVRAGFSYANDLPFTPWDDSGVASQMAGFTAGNIYLGGTLGFSHFEAGPVSIDPTVTGDLTVLAEPSGFASKKQDWLRALGANAALSIGLSLGDFYGFDYRIATGSFVFQRYPNGASQPSFAFAGDLQAGGQLGNLPVAFHAGVHADAFVDLNTVDDSFIDLSGELNLSAVTTASVSGAMHLSPTAGRFSGNANFAGWKIPIGGSVSPGSYSFSGSKGVNWTYSGWGVKATVKVSFTGGAPDLDASAKICAAGQCQGAPVKSISVDNGHVRVCVDVVGDKSCHSL